MSEDMYDYMEEMLDEKEGDCGTADIKGRLQQLPADSKSSIHPLWKLIDTWGGTMYLKARQLTLWGVEP